MKAFSDYDKVQVNNYAERLKLGGHICKILEVKTETFTSKKDNKNYDMLIIKFDIETPDEQAGYFATKFASDAAKDALNAKWKGYHRITIPTDSSEDFIKSRFKGFTTSIEESNPGYKWNWEENTLIGKVFGGVFALEEFVSLTGETISSSKIRYVKSTNKINEVEIPKVKLVDGTYMDYEEYIEKRKQERKNNSNNSTTNNTLDSGTLSSDELPF